MIRKWIPIIMLVLFLLGIGGLQLSAETVFRRSIPNVTVGRLLVLAFEEDVKDGLGNTQYTSVSYRKAIPKEMYDSGDVFAITTKEKNGTIRTYAQKMEISIGISNDLAYEVTNSSIDPIIKFILHSDQKINDGDEVYVVVE